MFVGETLGAFQFNEKYIFNQQIGKVLPYAMALVSHGKRDFDGGSHTSKADLVKQSTLVNLLKETRAQCVGYLENGSKYLFG